RLPAQILIDIRAIAQVAPAGVQIRPKASVPGEMIGSRVDKEEYRRTGELPGNGAHREVKIVRVGLLKAAQIFGIEEALDAGAGVEAARPDEGAVIGIHAEGAITAMAQRVRQPALDVTGCESCDRLGKTPVGAHRETGEHVVFGVPARAAGAFDQELALLAVERAKVLPIVRTDFNAWHQRGVE